MFEFLSSSKDIVEKDYLANSIEPFNLYAVSLCSNKAEKENLSLPFATCKLPITGQTSTNLFQKNHKL